VSERESRSALQVVDQTTGSANQHVNQTAAAAQPGQHNKTTATKIRSVREETHGGDGANMITRVFSIQRIIVCIRGMTVVRRERGSGMGRVEGSGRG
jgi:hypothetical protein